MPAHAQQPPASTIRVEDHLPLAYSVARRYRLQGHIKGLELEDLRQVAALGLIKAARRFQPARGARFGTFATLVMRQVIHDYLAVQHRLAGAPRPASQDERDEDFFATIPAREQGSHGFEVVELVKKLLDGLPARERGLVEARFGLNGHGQRSIAALAREEGVSRQRVSQLLLRSLDRMRLAFRRSPHGRRGSNDCLCKRR